MYYICMPRSLAANCGKKASWCGCLLLMLLFERRVWYFKFSRSKSVLRIASLYSLRFSSTSLSVLNFFQYFFFIFSSLFFGNVKFVPLPRKFSRERKKKKKFAGYTCALVARPPAHGISPDSERARACSGKSGRFWFCCM